MSPAVIAIVTFMATALLVGVWASSLERRSFRDRQLTNERLNELSTKGERRGKSSLFNDLSQGDEALASGASASTSMSISQASRPRFPALPASRCSPSRFVRSRRW